MHQFAFERASSQVLTWTQKGGSEPGLPMIHVRGVLPALITRQIEKFPLS